MPTHEHGYTAPEYIEFGSLLLHQVTALLAEGFAGVTALLLLMMMMGITCVAFLGCHECFKLIGVSTTSLLGAVNMKGRC